MNQEENVSPEENIVDKVAMPRLFRWCVRVYGILIVLLLSLGLLGVIARLVLEEGLFSALIDGTFTKTESLLFAGFLLLIIIMSVVNIIFGVALIRLRSWVLWPSILVAVNAFLYLYIYTTLPATYQNIVVTAFSVIFNLLSVVAAILLFKFRHTLTPSSWVGKTMSVLFTLFMLPYLAYGIASVVITDIDTIDDADLLLEPVPILAEEHNVYYALPDLQALNEQEKIQFEEALRVTLMYYQNEEIDLTQAVSAVSATREYTDQFIAAVKREGYQCPTSVNQHSYWTELCSLIDLRDLASLTALRSYVSLQLGDVDDAVTSSIAVLRFANQLEDSSTIVIEWLVSVASYNMAYQSIDYLINSQITDPRTASSSELIEIEEALMKYKPNFKQTLPNVIRGEHMAGRNSLLDHDVLKNEFGTDLQESYLWQPNRTINMFAELQRKHIEYMSLPCGEGEELVAELSNDVMDARINSVSPLSFVKPNLIGRVLFGTSAASLSNAKNKGCEVEAHHQELVETLESLSN